jgi:hypothetical protein
MHYGVEAYLILGVLILYSFFNFKSFKSDQFQSVGGQLAWLLFMTYQTYQNYERYNDKQLLYSYSKPFNGHRKHIGIPVIPNSWQISFEGRTSIHWNAKGNSLGHNDKYIALYKNRKLWFERDDYSLPSTGRKERSISVRYIYATTKHPDTLNYYYPLEIVHVK